MVNFFLEQNCFIMHIPVILGSVSNVFLLFQIVLLYSSYKEEDYCQNFLLGNETRVVGYVSDLMLLDLLTSCCHTHSVLQR